MKIIELVSNYLAFITNEEQDFIAAHPNQIKITDLNERGQWIARNLVRKGVYAISSDNNTMIKDEPNNRS